ncbi:c-type cytochrome [Alkalimarinus alittae]|uniref:C-type cytochrome n=2 Tax=Alkalimarinus alittae TaxID=2961619 RepID=A0ABY6N3E5_9ALTE|nr:c-type cytochrome [Alkalimarinus alittae]UZE96514.1 c-type cytochrome [Alkalimarinus alittae]
MNKVMRALAVFGLGAVLAGSVQAATDEDAILDRIKPIGDVCVEGQDCGSAAAAAPEAATGGARSGEDVYNASCFACHGTGAAGAPMLGNASHWGPRAEQGMDTLLSHAINGLNAMPPRGTCASCSDDEIAAAVEYMVEGSK